MGGQAISTACSAETGKKTEAKQASAKKFSLFYLKKTPKTRKVLLQTHSSPSSVASDPQPGDERLHFQIFFYSRHSCISPFSLPSNSFTQVCHRKGGKEEKESFLIRRTSFCSGVSGAVRWRGGWLLHWRPSAARPPRPSPGSPGGDGRLSWVSPQLGPLPRGPPGVAAWAAFPDLSILFVSMLQWSFPISGGNGALIGHSSPACGQ